MKLTNTGGDVPQLDISHQHMKLQHRKWVTLNRVVVHSGAMGNPEQRISSKNHLSLKETRTFGIPVCLGGGEEVDPDSLCL